MIRFGLQEHEFENLDTLIIQPLKRNGARVFIFGSRATGQYKKFSDIDILFEDPSDAIKDHLIFEITSEIEESHFPYKVDLVNFKNLATSYKASIQKEKIEV